LDLGFLNFNWMFFEPQLDVFYLVNLLWISIYELLFRNFPKGEAGQAHVADDW
jgi:hypothetical protein